MNTAPDTAPTITLDAEIVRKWRHDLQGPLSNIRAFSEELREALESVEQIKPTSNTTEDEWYALNVLFAEDIKPCMSLIERSVQQLQSSMDTTREYVDRLLENTQQR